MIKDLENIKGFSQWLQTVLYYGEVMSKKNHKRFSIFYDNTVYLLVDVYDVGTMEIYFMLV
jgi:hypothetical protein